MERLGDARSNPTSRRVFNEETAAGAAKLSARPLLLNIPYAGSPAPEIVPTSASHFAQWVQHRLDARKEGWDGIVLDLSALPSNTAFEVMDDSLTA